MKQNIFILAILLITCTAYSQPVKFEKLYYENENFSGEGNDIAALSNGDYLIGGFFSHAYFGEMDIMGLMRVNSIGSTVWAKEYDYGQSVNDPTASQEIKKAFPITGGKIMLFGNIYQHNFLIAEGILIAQADSSGNIIWSKIISDANNDYLTDAIYTSDGNFLAAVGNGCMKVDTAGNILWSNTFNASSPITSILEINNFYYLIAGQRNDSIIPVIKLSPGGNYVSSFNWNIPTAYIAASKTIKTHDGYIVNASDDNSNEDVLLFKSDTLGNIIWSKKDYGNAYFGFDLVETADSGFAILAGEVCTLPVNFLWIKTDASGDVINTNDYGADSENWPGKIIQTPDNGYLMTGLSAPGIYLVKTDSLGLTGCNGHCNYTNVSGVSTATYSGNYTASNNPITTISGSAVVESVLKTSIKCTNTDEIVYIPDPIFKAALLANPTINTNGDTSIQVREALAYSDTINVYGLGISNMTGIEAFTNIKVLNCGGNNIADLDLSFNKVLTALYCYNSNLLNLNISSNQYLTVLNVGKNFLFNLDVSSNRLLTSLECYGNSYSSLNLYANTSLTYLSCGLNDNLTSLDLSSNTALTYLNCSIGGLISLDVSHNSVLTTLYCYRDQLMSLNVKNGNNHNMTNANFLAYENPLLSCIRVDSVAYSTANWTNIDSWVGFGTNCSACNVNIPDVAFKTALLNNPAININGDGFIQCSEAIAYTGAINVSGLGISDLKGIEAFTVLTHLDCSNNNLESLNLSANGALTYLNCSHNYSLQSLDVSSNSALNYLNCSADGLTTLNVSSNTALTHLDYSFNFLPSLNISTNQLLAYLNCDDNGLTSLNLSSNHLLTYLDCGFNAFTSLNVSANLILDTLICYNNSLKNLNVSSNATLMYLECSFDSLTALNISSNSALSYLDCSFNSLTSVDASMNGDLNYLDCSFNSLITLNMKDGNNHNMPGANFIAYVNPALTCIQVDSAAYSIANWTNIDQGVSFRNNCAACVVDIPDANFKAILINNPAINTDGDEEIECTEAAAYNGPINVAGSDIFDLTGIKAFTSITYLDCSYNDIGSFSNTPPFDVSFLTALTYLDCSYNNIDSLNISFDAALDTLNCDNNFPLRTINASSNTALAYLDCSSDYNLNNLNISSNPALKYLNCQYINGLTNLDLSGDNELSYINTFFDLNLTVLNLPKSSLTYVECSYNGMSNLDASGNIFLTYLDCHFDPLTSLNVSGDIALAHLDCNADNGLIELDLSSCKALSYLNCEANSLTSLDLSTDTALTYLNCSYNYYDYDPFYYLTSLNVRNGNNLNMPGANFIASGNLGLTCIQVDSVEYSGANWTNIDPGTSFSTNCQPGGCSSSFTIGADPNQLHHYIVTNLASGVAPISYDWSWGDGAHDSGPYPSHTYTDSGFYDVCLTITDASNCTSTFCDNSFHAMRSTDYMVYIDVVPPIVTGIRSDSKQTAGFIIYPNPADNQVTIHPSAFQDQTVSVSIINILGEILQEENVKWSNDINLDVKNLPSGIYLVQVLNEKEKIVSRFAKE